MWWHKILVTDCNVVLTQTDQLLSRGESIDSIVSKSEDLGKHSMMFYKSSASLKRRMWWKNCKLISIVAFGLLSLVLGFYFFGWSFLVILLCLGIGGAASLRALIWTDSISHGNQIAVSQFCSVCGQTFSYSHSCPALAAQGYSQSAAKFVPQQMAVSQKEVRLMVLF